MHFVRLVRGSSVGIERRNSEGTSGNFGVRDAPSHSGHDLEPSARRGHSPLEALHELDNQFMEIEPDDPFADDLHPLVNKIQNAIGLLILGCRRRDVDITVQIAESIMRVLEEKLTDEAVSTEDFFALPEVQRELESQLEMIKHLRGDYTLDGGLRVMFRE